MASYGDFLLSSRSKKIRACCRTCSYEMYFAPVSASMILDLWGTMGATSAVIWHAIRA
jgi:hypothetical protein